MLLSDDGCCIRPLAPIVSWVICSSYYILLSLRITHRIFALVAWQRAASQIAATNRQQAVGPVPDIAARSRPPSWVRTMDYLSINRLRPFAIFYSNGVVSNTSSFLC